MALSTTPAINILWGLAERVLESTISISVSKLLILKGNLINLDCDIK